MDKVIFFDIFYCKRLKIEINKIITVIPYHSEYKMNAKDIEMVGVDDILEYKEDWGTVESSSKHLGT